MELKQFDDKKDKRLSMMLYDAIVLFCQMQDFPAQFTYKYRGITETGVKKEQICRY